MKVMVFRTLLALFLVFGLSAAAHAQRVEDLPPEVLRQGFADLVLLNGKIVSIDDAGNNDNPGTIYQAMAVKNDRIMALGTDERIGRMVSSFTQSIDLKGRTAIPGLIHSHSHIYGVERWADELGIPLPRRISVPEGETIPETRQNIKDALQKIASEVEPGEWIVAGMVPNPVTGASRSNTWGRQGLLAHREFLDGVIRRNPVLLRAGTRGVINSMALEEANNFMPGYSVFINESIGRGGDHAERTGLVGSQEMASITWEIFLRDVPLATLAEAIRRNLEQRLTLGWTGFSTRIPMPTILSAFVYLDRNGLMPIRLGAHYETHRRAAPPAFTRAFYAQTGALWGLGSDFLWITGVASERWDSLGTDACIGPDFPAPPEIKAREYCSEPGSLWWDVIKTATIAGWRPAGIHGVGSHSLRLFTQLLDEVVEETGLTVEDIRRMRPSMEHCNFIGTRPDVIEKLQKYNIIIGCMAPGGFLFMLEDYGSELETFMTPVKSMLDAGLTVVAEEGTFSGVSEFITRDVNAREAIDRVRALKMRTRWVAEYVIRPDDLGSLELGKFADFVVLDRDYFTIPVNEIPEVMPLLTAVGGEVRFLYRDFARELGLQPVGPQPE